MDNNSTGTVERLASQTAPGLMEKAVCLVINRSGIGTTRTVNSTQIEVNADKKLVHVQKELFDCQELNAIYSLDTKMDEYIASRCLPSLFKRSVYLLPVGLVGQVDERLTVHVEKRKELVEKFCAGYEKAVESAKERLKDLFSEEDYPNLDYVRSKFDYSWQYVQFGVSPVLADISQAVYQREQEKAKQFWAEAKENLLVIMRKQTLELVNHMVSLVSPAEEGKRKVFHGKAMDAINDFLTTFNDRNLADDEQLQAIVGQMKDALNGVTPATLKSDEALRGAIQTKFTEIKTALDGMVSDAPVRQFRFAAAEEGSETTAA